MRRATSSNVPCAVRGDRVTRLGRRRASRARTRRCPPTSDAGGLTATERRVAELAVNGLANKEIARTLVVTVNTVEFHLRNTYAKLGISSARSWPPGSRRSMTSPADMRTSTDGKDTVGRCIPASATGLLSPSHQR